jgi:peptidoglycan pentaglycine glycine transferase (the first glycine)
MSEVSVSREGLDPAWDDFLETMPDGCYQQSSLWAGLKSSGGWRPLRAVVKENGHVIGGAQMLLRPIKSFGSVGYISKGPVVASDDLGVQDYVLEQVDRVAKAEGVLYLKVQPPNGEEGLAARLLERGAVPSEEEVVSVATARVDIRPEPEEIMARMSRGRRKAIRRAERDGVVVRKGTEADIVIFHQLLRIHSQQRGYSPYPDNYHRSLYTTFLPGGHSCLLIAEYEGEALAAMIILGFGDVVFGMFIVDSGNRPELSAQSLLRWETILWGKEKGYAWYDFGGISPSIAQAVQNGEHVPDDTREGRLARSKLSFGSQVLLRPGACDISYVWPRRVTGRMIPLVMKMQPLVRSLLGGSLYGDYQ